MSLMNQAAERRCVYLASPYSHENAIIREERCLFATRAAANLMRCGYTVFSPIAHSHAVAQFLPQDLLLDFDFWMEQDLPYIQSWADCLIVLTLSGFQESRGVNHELIEATRFRIPVLYLSFEETEAMVRTGAPCPR